MNASAEESMRFALLSRLPIAMLDPDNIERSISKMAKNMIRHSKGLRKELIINIFLLLCQRSTLFISRCAYL